ncbi:MAG: hypothetical protein ACTHZX_00455 [Microbacterium sp.]
MSGATRESADIGQKKAGRAIRIPSLDEAFERYGIPVANRDLIRTIYANTDTDGIVGFADFFQLKRRGGHPALEVHAGYTNGFRSEQDAIRRAGEVPRWPSRRFHGAWGVDHPVDRPARGSSPSRGSSRAESAPRRRAASPPPAPAPVCPTCFLELPASGVCPNCDD